MWAAVRLQALQVEPSMMNMLKKVWKCCQTFNNHELFGKCGFTLLCNSVILKGPHKLSPQKVELVLGNVHKNISENWHRADTEVCMPINNDSRRNFPSVTLRVMLPDDSSSDNVKSSWTHNIPWLNCRQYSALQHSSLHWHNGSAEQTSQRISVLQDCLHSTYLWEHYSSL